MKSNYFKNFVNKISQFKFGNFYNFIKFTNRTKQTHNSFNSSFNFKHTISTLGFISLFSLNNVALCSNISDREIDKIRLSLEEQIKKLEFDYGGKIKRQNVK